MTVPEDRSAIPRRLVVDDTRTVVWNCTLVQTVEQALAFLGDLDEPLEELWLDFDLGFDADRQRVDVMPLVDVLVERAASGDPVKVERVYIHSANLLGRTADAEGAGGSRLPRRNAALGRTKASAARAQVGRAHRTGKQCRMAKERRPSSRIVSRSCAQAAALSAVLSSPLQIPSSRPLDQMCFVRRATTQAVTP